MAEGGDIGSTPLFGAELHCAQRNYTQWRGTLLFAERHAQDRPVIGVIGLGTIGGGIAINVHAAALPLVVYDIRSEATLRHAEYATVATSPSELARQSDVVVVAVVNDEQVRAVLLGSENVLSACVPDTTVVVVSTITTECVAAIGADAGSAECR